MEVTEVRTTVVGTPWRELVFVELETDTGLTGVGEVRPVNKTDSFLATVEELAARYVIGADPFDTERLAWRSNASNTVGRANTANRRWRHSTSRRST